MAGSILVGVLILGLASYLFMTFAGFSKEHADAIVQKQQDQFNQRFLKYDGEETITDEERGIEITRPVLVSAHDIITLANLATQNNKDQELEDYEPQGAEQDALVQYISVYVQGESRNLEKWSKEQRDAFVYAGTNREEMGEKYYKIYYECTDVRLSEQTGYVYSITFRRIPVERYAGYIVDEGDR